MRKQAVILDMDGVLADSEPLYAQAISEALEGTGFAMSSTDHQAIMGSSIDYTWEWVMERFGLGRGPAYWKDRYDKAVLRLLTEKASPMPGMYRLLDRLEERSLKLGLASSSKTDWVEAILSRLGIADRFGSVATCDMVQHAKPSPDLYLLAAHNLGVAPFACLAIEDSSRGIQAAKSAGMVAVGIRTPTMPHMDLSAADHISDCLDGFDFSWLD